jgi:transcriptional regulator with XRE-family HTH domain
VTDVEDDERPLRSALGKAIRLRRVELDLSRADLAREADVSYTYVSEIENGTKQASSKTLWRIARALGLEPHELMALAAQWETRPPGPEASPAPPAAVPSAAPAAPGSGEGSPPLSDLLFSLGGARFVEVDPKVVQRLAAAEGSLAPVSRWFHSGRGSAASEQAGTAERADVDEPSGPAAITAELVEVLDRIAAALDGVPDERADLALMLTLDERRTRRIVREELDRRGL